MKKASLILASEQFLEALTILTNRASGRTIPWEYTEAEYIQFLAHGVTSPRKGMTAEAEFVLPRFQFNHYADMIKEE